MWDAIIEFLARLITLYESFIGDWGLAIILFTVIIRILLLPLTLKQQKSMVEMQHVQPILKEMQTKYADDPQRLNEEMMKFYSEHKFNPLSGCLPLLIQMPIFFALFSVLRYHIPGDAHFFGILPSLVDSASTVLSASGFVSALPYIVFVLLFGVLTFLPMLLQSNNQMSRTMQLGMVGIMTVMMLFVGWSSPAGVVLFWVTSSAWAVIQQQFILSRRNKQYEEEEKAKIATKPVEVDVVRREKKARPTKKR